MKRSATVLARQVMGVCCSTRGVLVCLSRQATQIYEQLANFACPARWESEGTQKRVAQTKTRRLGDIKAICQRHSPFLPEAGNSESTEWLGRSHRSPCIVPTERSKQSKLTLADLQLVVGGRGNSYCVCMGEKWSVPTQQQPNSGSQPVVRAGASSSCRPASTSGVQDQRYACYACDCRRSDYISHGRWSGNADSEEINVRWVRFLTTIVHS